MLVAVDAVVVVAVEGVLGFNTIGVVELASAAEPDSWAGVALLAIVVNNCVDDLVWGGGLLMATAC